MDRMNSDSFRRDIETLIGRTLTTEARRNELKLAYVRAAAIGVSALLDLVVYLNPRAALGVDSVSPAVVLFSATWAVIAVALALALRAGWYRGWMREAIPVLDGGLVCVLFVNLHLHVAPFSPKIPAIFANLTAVAALLAVSGGLRLSRAAALTTTAFGVLAFAMASLLFRLDGATTAFSGVTLLAVGLIAVWMTGVVRRQAEAEIGRAMLERFLPRKVVVDAHENPLALVTEPRSLDVTVVVTDLRGFTSLAEAMTPAEVLQFLNRIQGALAEAVREHGGTVDKFLGDGMLAVFGAPEPQADHAQRAIRAAESMRRALAEFNRERSGEGQPAVRMGIGIHSGPAVVGCIGSGLRLEFTVIGDTVNTASRLEALTKEKGADVLLSGETLRRAGLDARSVGDTAIRGKKDPLPLYALP
jgi:class 3 adenylate cyclase